jgi:hypothetical protein
MSVTIDLSAWQTAMAAVAPSICPNMFLQDDLSTACLFGCNGCGALHPTLQAYVVHVLQSHGTRISATGQRITAHADAVDLVALGSVKIRCGGCAACDLSELDFWMHLRSCQFSAVTELVASLVAGARGLTTPMATAQATSPQQTIAKAKRPRSTMDGVSDSVFHAKLAARETQFQEATKRAIARYKAPQSGLNQAAENYKTQINVLVHRLDEIASTSHPTRDLQWKAVELRELKARKEHCLKVIQEALQARTEAAKHGKKRRMEDGEAASTVTPGAQEPYDKGDDSDRDGDGEHDGGDSEHDGEHYTGEDDEKDHVVDDAEMDVY